METIRRFLDDDDRLKQWPAKRAMQLAVLTYLASKFDTNTVYTERQVNDILHQWHTYGDWATLRRALVDYQFLTRKRDGSEYRRAEDREDTSL